jgi:phasin
MSEMELRVPAELRYSAEKMIDQAEKAFGLFFDAANKLAAAVPSPTTEMSRTAVGLAERNLKAAFDNGRKLVHATDFQQVVQIQSEFLKCQFASAGEQMKQMADEVVAAAKDASRNQH